MRRNFISIKDVERDAFMQMVDRSVHFAKVDRSSQNQLDGRIVGIYFKKTSTRTRTSFSVGALRLGAKIVTYGPHHLQTNT